MSAYTARVTLQIKHDSSDNWNERNPVLLVGEYGLESDTLLLKIGDGEHDWQHLPYLNNFDNTYFTRANNGTLSLSTTFIDSIAAQSTENCLKCNIVMSLPPTTEGEQNTLYLVLGPSGRYYETYILIDGAWALIGGGGGGSFTLDVATDTQLGGVKSVNDSTSDYLRVTQEGFIALNKVPTSKLYVPSGDVLVIHGGTA